MTFLMQGRQLEQFHALLSEPDQNGCVRWAGEVDACGRGIFCKHPRSPFPTRVKTLVWELKTGEPPNGAWIVRSCGDKDCYAAEHLVPKTRKSAASTLSPIDSAMREVEVYREALDRSSHPVERERFERNLRLAEKRLEMEMAS